MDSTKVLDEFKGFLSENDYSENTIWKYLRDVKAFFLWVGEKKAWSAEVLRNWKRDLVLRYAPSSVNSMLAALNRFLEWRGMGDLKVRLLRIQKWIFSDVKQELTRDEYRRMLKTAETMGKERLALILRTLASTGMRISELKYVTVETLESGVINIWNKGKARKILLPGRLCVYLRRYCRREKCVSGSVFVSSRKNPLDRSNIWREMKKLCQSSGVIPEKVFPHNLRHLFARTFYREDHDLARLGDILGHSSLSTTRIYIRESGEECRRILERMRLV
ncbi:tyrosine-type recombinase/integrase [Clostridium sp.]